MPKTIGEFIFDLAKKAGVKEDDKSLLDFVQDKDLFTKPFPEALQTGIDNQLISISDALNNHPQIKAKYYSQFTDGMDKVLHPLLAEFDNESKSEIESEPSTFKRVPIMFNKIKELEAKKATTTGKGDKGELQKEIDSLHEQIKTINDAQQKKDKDHESQLSKVRVKYKLDSLTGTYKTIYDDLDPEVKSMTVEALINKELQDKRAAFAFDDNGSFTLIKEDGSNYFGDNHQRVEPKAFIEQILSRNKLLKVTDQNAGNGNQGANQNSHSQPNGGSGKPERNNALHGLVQNSIKDLENANSVTIMG